MPLLDAYLNVVKGSEGAREADSNTIRRIDSISRVTQGEIDKAELPQ